MGANVVHLPEGCSSVSPRTCCLHKFPAISDTYNVVGTVGEVFEFAVEAAELSVCCRCGRSITRYFDPRMIGDGEHGEFVR